MSKASRILEEHPDFGRWLVEVFPDENLEEFFKFYSIGLEAKQVKMIIMMGKK